MARRSVLRLLALALAAGALADVPTRAQEVTAAADDATASLVADEVSFDRESRVLTASGNVEVLYRGRVLRASRIVYDEGANRISAEGPIVLTDPAGGVVLADSAALTPDLETGLIESARLLIAGRMQLAAAEIRRNSQYATLYRTVASSCTICAENPTPTWAIRAARVTRDEAAQRIYFEDARFQLFGIPIGWLPRASIPEPGVSRASGVLLPSFHQSQIYGFGFKLPYYRVLGPSADVTLTPFLTTGGARILEGQYRRRFASGGFDLSGAIAFDDGLDDAEDGPRGAVSALGAFNLGHDFIADFDINYASDESFLGQFDYSDADRLTSTAAIHRSRPDEYVSLGTVAFQALAGSQDDQTTIPFALPEFSYRRLFDTPEVGGGTLGVDAQSLGILRESGQNMLRAGGSVDWTRDGVLPHGILAEGIAVADFDYYHAWQNPGGIDETDTGRTVPTASLQLRWPWMSATAAAQHVVEPVVQVIYSHAFGDENVPNEDSLLPEFDDTNLYSLNRFPGEDRLELGLRANLGVSYTRQDPDGWSTGITLGRVVRESPDDQFTEGTGLGGRWSDYVAAISLDFDWGLTLVNRALFGDGFDFRRNEFALAYDGARGAVRAAYVYLAEDESDPVLGNQPETSEIALDARYRFLPNWEMRGLWRYDAVSGSNLRAGAGISYGNECAEFDLAISRRYTYSDNLPPSTSVSFGLKLAGLGESGETKWPARVCMRGT